jgi:hypothetical protein
VARIRVQDYGRPVGLQQSFDGLVILTRHALRQDDPVSEQLFVFFNPATPGTSGGQVIEVGKALGIRGLLTGGEDR